MHIWAATKTSAYRTNSVDSEMCVRRIGYIEMVGYIDTSGSFEPYQSTRKSSPPSSAMWLSLKSCRSWSGVGVSVSVSVAVAVAEFLDSVFSKLLWSCGMDGLGSFWSDFFQSEGSISSGYRKSLLPEINRKRWPNYVSRKREAILVCKNESTKFWRYVVVNAEVSKCDLSGILKKGHK